MAKLSLSTRLNNLVSELEDILSEVEELESDYDVAQDTIIDLNDQISTLEHDLEEALNPD